MLIPQVIHLQTIKINCYRRLNVGKKYIYPFYFQSPPPDVYNRGKTLQLREPQQENIAACVPLINRTQSSFIYCKRLTQRCLEVCMFHPLYVSSSTQLAPGMNCSRQARGPQERKRGPIGATSPSTARAAWQGGELSSHCPSLPGHLHTGDTVTFWIPFISVAGAVL